MKVFVSSSWRNELQPTVVSALRRAGHEVYDFRAPAEGTDGFSWSHLDPRWQSWSASEFRASLTDPRVLAGFEQDMTALRGCDVCLMVQPCGRSAALELGWAAGAGKSTIVLLAGGEPKLMLRMAHHFCCTLEEVLEALTFIESHGPR